MLLASRTAAQRVRIGTGATPGCPGAQRLQARIAERYPGAPAELAIRVERLPGRSEARPHRYRIVASQAAQTAERELELGPSDCAARCDAIALVAVTLAQSLPPTADEAVIPDAAAMEAVASAPAAPPSSDSAASSARPSGSGRTATPPRQRKPVAQAAELAPPMRPAIAAAEAPAATAQQDSAAHVTTRDLPPAQWLLAVGAAVRSGLAPDPAPWPQLGVALNWRGLGSVELRSGLGWPQRHAIEEGSLELSAYTVALGACFVPLSGVPRLSLCADVHGGLEVGAASGLRVENHTRTHPLLLLAGRLEFEALRLGPMRAFVFADAGGVVIRPRFVVQRSDGGPARGLGASAFSAAIGTNWAFAL